MDKSGKSCYLFYEKDDGAVLDCADECALGVGWGSCDWGKLNENYIDLEKEKSKKAKEISHALYKYLSSFGISKEVTKGQMTKIIKKYL
jgi:hypothetical protein